MDEITSEEEGMMEEEDEEFGDEVDDIDADMDFDEVELDDEDEGDEVEDAVVRIEDKLEQLMAQFEEIMGGDADIDDDAGMDADEEINEDTERVGYDFYTEVIQDMIDNNRRNMSPSRKDRVIAVVKRAVQAEGGVFDEDSFNDAYQEIISFNRDIYEEEVMESVQLQKVAPAKMGDDGVQTKSPVTANSGQAGIASKPVKASTSTETGRTAPTTTDVKGAGSFKNAPGHKKQDLATAPKPVKSQASGVNTKSPVAK